MQYGGHRSDQTRLNGCSASDESGLWMAGLDGPHDGVDAWTWCGLGLGLHRSNSSCDRVHDPTRRGMEQCVLKVIGHTNASVQYFMLQMCPLDHLLCRLWQATIQVPTNRHDSRGFLEHIPQIKTKQSSPSMCQGLDGSNGQRSKRQGRRASLGRLRQPDEGVASIPHESRDGQPRGELTCVPGVGKHLRADAQVVTGNNRHRNGSTARTRILSSSRASRRLVYGSKTYASSPCLRKNPSYTSTRCSLRTRESAWIEASKGSGDAAGCCLM